MTFEYILLRDSKPAYCSNASNEVRAQQIENVQWCAEYAERGYTNPAKGILFGNWNYFSRKAANLLERAGYELEWSDEWTTCVDCNKALRTSPDCYSWQPYYVLLNDCEIVCLDCIDWQEYLENIQDNPHKAVMSACDPSKYGYRLISSPAQFENGLHKGMDDKPDEILKRYQAQGKHGLVFRVPETSQFYITFEVWQHIEVGELPNTDETEEN